jgi:CheY-like chemotaxis protein
MTTQSKGTILVVDDDQDLREAIGFDLRRRNCHVLYARSGRTALDALRSEPVDLIISDVRMPDGDGVELLKTIRNDMQRMPVLMFVTGFLDLGLEEAYQLGADAVFSKPFDRSAFFAAIDYHLTPSDKRWANPPGDPATDLNIALQYSSLEDSLRRHLVNIGRGGIFVALKEGLPEIGAAVQFALSFDDGSPELSGRGIVRWSRCCDATLEKPLGCGIEFSYLDEAGRNRILEHIRSTRATAFIPWA